MRKHLLRKVIYTLSESSGKTQRLILLAISWELLTRKHPFGEYNWMAEVEEAVIDGQRPAIPNDTPSAFAKLIRDCWDQNPGFYFSHFFVEK